MQEAVPRKLSAVVERALKKKEMMAWGGPTLGQEVIELVRVWYAALGRPVPESEQITAKEIDDAEVEAEKQRRVYALSLEKEGYEQTQKPEFGTPGFWAWARKQKAAKDAARKAKGLLPLPKKAVKKAVKATSAP